MAAVEFGSKGDAVRGAINNLGKDATYKDIMAYVRENAGFDVSQSYISTVKKDSLAKISNNGMRHVSGSKQQQRQNIDPMDLAIQKLIAAKELLEICGDLQTAIEAVKVVDEKFFRD